MLNELFMVVGSKQSLEDCASLWDESHSSWMLVNMCASAYVEMLKAQSIIFIMNITHKIWYNYFQIFNYEAVHY